MQFGTVNTKEKLLLKNGVELDISKFRGQVIHNDVDGLISGACINHYLNIPISGIFELHPSQYNYSKLIVNDDNYKISKHLYVDLALKDKHLTSLDHHRTLKEVYNLNPNIINANRYYSKSYDAMQWGSLSHKNPTGCLHYILYLLDIDISMFTEKQKILISLADGLHSVYNNYTENVENWLEMFGQEELLDTLQNTPPAYFQFMREHIGLDRGQYFNYNEVSQKYVWNNGKNFIDVLDNITDVMEWERVAIPDFTDIIMFQNKEAQATQQNINDIMEDGNVFSVAVNGGDGKMQYSTYAGWIKIK
jgi:hypothetical protein